MSLTLALTTAAKLPYLIAHGDWTPGGGMLWLAGGAVFAALGSGLFVIAAKASAPPTRRPSYGNWKSDRQYR